MGTQSRKAKSSEKKAEKLYGLILKDVTKLVGHSKSTYLDELSGVGNKLLHPNFRGTFPSDKIPLLNGVKKYCILNLDNSSQPGSHWIALAKEGNKTYVYDSFGRHNTQIIENLQYSGNGRIIDSDQDAEQGILESNCGQRSLAWLKLFDEHGSKIALLI